MVRRQRVLGAAVMALALLGAGFTVSGVAFAAPPLKSLDDAFKINYYVNATIQGSNGFNDYVRVTDTDPQVVPGETEPADLCVNVYVFDTNQEMEECCACPITAAGRLDFLVGSNLTSNPLVGPTRPLNNGIIHLVSTTSDLTLVTGVPGHCDPTDSGGTGSPYSFSPSPSIRAWITHAQSKYNNQTVTEEVFADTGTQNNDYVNLSDTCTNVQRIGAQTKRGVCTCPAED
jgi:hypothetical protein